MKPQLLKLALDVEKSFNVRKDVVLHFYNRWHYHPEVELVLIEKGSGTQFIGDRIENFKAGDLLMIGSNLPHYWSCDSNYFQENSNLKAEATVIHFTEDFWGKKFIELPENKGIKDLLEKARQGIRITGSTYKKVKKLMKELLNCTGAERLIFLLQILSLISVSNEIELICNQNLNFPSFETTDTERINRIYSFILANSSRKITLAEIADVANLTPHAFCRYFKFSTRKTFSRFLIEIRIGKACKLLTSGNLSVAQICYDCGYNNYANFNRQFKSITGLSPLGYQKLYRKGNVNLDH